MTSRRWSYTLASLVTVALILCSVYRPGLAQIAALWVIGSCLLIAAWIGACEYVRWRARQQARRRHPTHLGRPTHPPDQWGGPTEPDPDLPDWLNGRP